MKFSRALARFALAIVLTYLGLLAVTFFIGRVIPVDPVLAVVGDYCSIKFPFTISLSLN